MFDGTGYGDSGVDMGGLMSAVEMAMVEGVAHGGDCREVWLKVFAEVLSGILIWWDVDAAMGSLHRLLGVEQMVRVYLSWAPFGTCEGSACVLVSLGGQEI